ncbi:hypothetical protein WICMUC_002961 [Wickerhamomyces mucosus]|uniref:protein-tyrosine-phosphatase n=1 Tax=Wickerhamomyces mucosus TaxID=1378264 RepID=A0A9P8TDB5_9ASCO|nr:hypothetical protein WICMUC_002961 [Wickerhamomyces mucosus]
MSNHTLSQPVLSPRSKRNTKNLSLQLNQPKYSEITSTIEPIAVKTPTTPSASFKSKDPFRTSPNGARVYRHPSLSRSNPPLFNSTSGGLKRRSTLSLSIPSEKEISNIDKDTSGNKSSSNNSSIPSFSSASPIYSSPIIPSTPTQFLSFKANSLTFNDGNKSTSQTTLLPNGETLKTQTLIQNLTNLDISADDEATNLYAYPNGPVCVFEPNLFLYSEPTLNQLQEFKLVINVAKECIPPIPYSKDQLNASNEITNLKYGDTDYYYVPWTHTSKLCKDLPQLISIIQSYLSRNEKILIHCQCGVSRSASLIIALFMKLNMENLNDSYNKLKVKADKISPNMSLIFQLMEWGELLGINSTSITPSVEKDCYYP